MFNEYEEVRVKTTGRTVLIVDKNTAKDGKNWYIVEDNMAYEETGDPWYDVWEDDIERIDAVAV